VDDRHPGAAIDMQALGRFGGQAAKQLRRGIELSRHPMLLADDQRRWVLANAAAEELLGASLRELPWRTMDDFTPPSGRKRLEEQWQAFLTNGAAEGWYRLSLADRRTIRVEFSATAHVLPARHLAVFIQPPTQPTAGSPIQESAWTAVASGAERPARLTRREREVITLIAGGAQSTAIAEHLLVSPATIKTHVENAMNKLGAHTRAHAVAIALVTGQIVWSMYGVSGGVTPEPEPGEL
jgi:PAS domain S-box-containing protein